MPPQKVVVVGAGPVGSLAALYAASRGDDVEIYELREDIRSSTTAPVNFTKSINLALSERGINAMRSSGRPKLLDGILDSSIPMHGRMIHGSSSKGTPFSTTQAYDVHGRFIRAADRGLLNKRLLDELDTLPNVTFRFQHKLTGADFAKNIAHFEDRSGGTGPDASSATVHFDLLVGADGAHSAVRHFMMRRSTMNFSQEYIDTLWCEFHIAPSSGPTPTYRLPPNYLHIWPGGSFMFIALPNADKSFTCTLFAPRRIFDHLSASPESNLSSFFGQNFPSIVPNLISLPDLISQYATNPHLPLINVKASPHHLGSSAVLLGDSANAMVPFYGQGMNAGLESVRVLFSFLDAHGIYSTSSPFALAESRQKALEEYTAYRVADAHAIADLALENYHEMRSGVTDPWYKVRKLIEEGLDRLAPRLGWKTQYSRVSFGNERYSHVKHRSRRQAIVLAWLGRTLSVSIVGLLLLIIRLTDVRSSSLALGRAIRRRAFRLK
ncbi:MAG: hypothetical protein Q9160_005212 [Pyrenula sp. 1 TL-2023]